MKQKEYRNETFLPSKYFVKVGCTFIDLVPLLGVKFLKDDMEGGYVRGLFYFIGNKTPINVPINNKNDL